MIWFVIIVAIIGYVFYRVDKKLKIKFEDKFNPADWDLPATQLPATQDGDNPATLNLTSTSSITTTKFEKQDTLFTSPEKLFFNALQASLGQDYQLLAKISLSDIIRFDLNSLSPALAKLATLKVNFVVCNKSALNLVCVIELTEKLLDNSTEAAGTSTLQTLCKNAGVVHVSVNRQMKYDTQQLRTKILSAINSLDIVDRDSLQPNLKTPMEKKTDIDEATTSCPKCAAIMSKRKSKTQGHEEKLFWVCSRFPECKGIIEIASH
jgi:ssDNA-binding Zn-finger/Zn-ribbon topoisomerase 1